MHGKSGKREISQFLGMRCEEAYIDKPHSNKGKDSFDVKILFLSQAIASCFLNVLN